MDSYEKGILLTKRSNDAPIPVVYGERLLGGVQVFLETSGSDNQYLYMAVALAEGEINSVEQIIVNDKVVKFDGALTRESLLHLVVRYEKHHYSLDRNYGFEKLKFPNLWVYAHVQCFHE